MLLENRLNDVTTIKQYGLLDCEGHHDGDLFSLLIRAIDLGKNANLDTSAIAEVLLDKLVSLGLKTRDYARINGLSITSDRDGNHYCNDEFFSSKNELKNIILTFNTEYYVISDDVTDNYVIQIYEYLDNRSNYPR